MSFEQNYGTLYQPYDEDRYEAEPIFSKDEILEAQIEMHIAEQEAELENLKETWRVLYEK